MAVTRQNQKPAIEREEQEGSVNSEVTGQENQLNSCNKRPLIENISHTHLSNQEYKLVKDIDSNNLRRLTNNHNQEPQDLDDDKNSSIVKQRKLSRIADIQDNHQDEAHRLVPNQTEQTNTPTSTTTSTPDSSQAEGNETGNPRDKTQRLEGDREISLLAKLSIDCLMFLIKTIIIVYTYLSQPIYYYKQGIAAIKHDVEGVQRSLKAKSPDNSYVWRQINIEPLQLKIETKINSYTTYDALIRDSICSHGEQPCYAYRKVLHEHWSKKSESDNKLIKKVALSEYNWVNYDEFERQIEATRRAFLLEGIRPGDKVIIYSDTRPEWQISSQALVRIGAIVVTMYSTLGQEGIVHVVNDTGVTHILAQKDKVSKLLKLKSKLPRVKKIIYYSASIDLPTLKAQANGSGNNSPRLERRANSSESAQAQEETKTWSWSRNADFDHPSVEFRSFNDLLLMGAAVPADKADELAKLEEEAELFCSKRTRDTIAVIMYTSGSTGIPKGVLITHGNISGTLKSYSYVTKDFIYRAWENSLVAYLPLAHIFEFCIQSLLLFHGVKFGYGTPHTLTDKSPGLIQGQKGDLTLLRPTTVIMVPLVLDRIAQGIKQTLKAQSYFKEQLVSYLLEYKMYWQARYYQCPIIDRLICSKIAAALGGRAKFLICGSAPLSSATQRFIRAALNIKLPQGFGTTETCGSSNCQLFDDQTTENVGIPVVNCYIKLEPWYEANYSPNDKPNPRGEIVVGGENICAGYFNLDEQTKEAFYTDSENIRWYRTGDIGEFLPNGNLRIIDRKKDLVKLQNGEYISLGKVESTFKSNPYTDNFCAYANSRYNYIVALAPANELAIRSLAQQIVESHIQQGSPSMRSRKASDADLSAANNQEPSQDKETQRAIEELQDVLASYESDRLNNNEDSEDPQQVEGRVDRKMSSLSTASSVAAGGINERLQRLCDNKLIQERVMTHFKSIARERNLMSLEIPRKIYLLAEEWTEDKNLVTAAMKIRRNYIYKRYEKELERLYSKPSMSSSASSSFRSNAAKS